MPTPVTERLLRCDDERHTIDEYKGRGPRWCIGCGNHAILTSLQRLCRDEGLLREKTVFVSGIGCSSRLPHYMNTYGFHGLHGRALPVAEGIRMTRPDLNVFVVTGDGDCCSIGTAHWIHAVRYNMDMTVLLHDNQVYGLTKMQASPTSPRGFKSNTSPHGTNLDPLNPLSVTLGISNVSFVAQVVDWIPDLLYSVISEGFRHKGFSFIRLIQRCPEFLPTFHEARMRDPASIHLLSHDDGIRVDPTVARSFPNQEEHDPSDLDRAREIASISDRIPVGVLYRNIHAPRYENAQETDQLCSADTIKQVLDDEFDKFTVGQDR